jgi:hypothetical protein
LQADAAADVGKRLPSDATAGQYVSPEAAGWLRAAQNGCSGDAAPSGQTSNTVGAASKSKHDGCCVAAAKPRHDPLEAAAAQLLRARIGHPDGPGTRRRAEKEKGSGEKSSREKSGREKTGREKTCGEKRSAEKRSAATAIPGCDDNGRNSGSNHKHCRRHASGRRRWRIQWRPQAHGRPRKQSAPPSSLTTSRIEP